MEAHMMRLVLGALLLLGLIAIAEVRADDLAKATLYRNSNCGCCLEYARYLRRQGFDVDVVGGGMTSIRDEHGVPEDLEGCHTMVIGGYVIEGHVPAPIIKRLLAERPAIRGISLPGMPNGSPGMTGVKQGTFTIYEIGDGPRKVYGTD